MICNPNWTLPPKNECVNFDGSLKVMKEQCDGKQSCKVSKGLFPCYKTIKVIITKNFPNTAISMYMHILKQVKASSDIFGETCKLTYKYLEAEYQCQGI